MDWSVIAGHIDICCEDHVGGYEVAMASFVGGVHTDVAVRADSYSLLRRGSGIPKSELCHRGEGEWEREGERE